jgi:hypothetical protein
MLRLYIDMFSPLLFVTYTNLESGETIMALGEVPVAIVPVAVNAPVKTLPLLTPMIFLEIGISGFDLLSLHTMWCQFHPRH